MNKRYIASLVAGSLLTVAAGSGALALADTSPTLEAASTLAQHMDMGAAGTVTAVNGNTITITGKDGTTYTVEAGAAAITKDMTASLTDIKVGDTIMAQGSTSGTTVTATAIHDGKMPEGGMHGRGGMGGVERGVHGTVTAVSGTTLTVTATNPTTSTTATYTVDASSAKVLKGDGTTKPADSTLSAVAVGDTVGIQGEVTGTNIVAKMIIDGPAPKDWPMRGMQPPTTTITQ